jgi:hypothetical protein
MLKQAIEGDGGASVGDAVMDFECAAGKSAPWLSAVADLPTLPLCRIEDD